MAIVPYSAFDPIFWLHHANVDRLIAIWQALYPDSWASVRQINSAGTYTNEPGSSEDGNTGKFHVPRGTVDHYVTDRSACLALMLTASCLALTPFHSDGSGTLYTSNSARYTRTFGYSYPEVVDWAVSADELASNVRAKFNTLYSPLPNSNIKARARNFHASSDTQRRQPMTFEWLARFTVERCQTPPSLLVHVFLGPVPGNTSTWSYASNLVGSHAFLSPGQERAARLGQARGQIPLNKKLERAGIPCQSSEHVLQHLSTSLTWALQHLNGTPVEVSTMPSFRFFVSQQMVRPGTCLEEFPTWMGGVSHIISTAAYSPL